MAGTHQVENGVLVFRPAFPFSPGLTVRAVFRATPAASPVETSFAIPRPELRSTTRVVNVYPSADTVPSNQLKFYLQFSAAMERGRAWSHLTLLNGKGERVELPFLEIDEELWDREQKRLTVLFDPGRIKRGLLPLEEVGPAIVEGETYTLVIAQRWADAQGNPLVSEFRKQFRVAAAERKPVDPLEWRIQPPTPGTREPFRVVFPAPLDYALLQRLLAVEFGGATVLGSIGLANQEREWLFTPHEPWIAGDYALRIDTALEDLAGNRIGRAFDVDEFDPVTKQVQRVTTSIRFRIE